MNQIQLACCALIASACVLAGLLVVNMENKQILSSADAEVLGQTADHEAGIQASV